MKIRLNASYRTEPFKGSSSTESLHLGNSLWGFPRRSKGRRALLRLGRSSLFKRKFRVVLKVNS